ncbi:tRNA-dihydrouridine synthase [Vairimorpha necatrix]|uniref:tRNA-dihydrouridine synthase n=1 Tax=Vairimorpha necatrix TaxID=6039 RepID=A0AAX4JBG8_9MICR
MVNEKNFKSQDYRNLEISLAPMLEVTTANFRKFVRISSKHTLLFTEMIVSNTVINISTTKLLQRLGDIDDLTVVQIGGSDPTEISSAISILKQHGCKHFNLNLGCPSSRVQKGCFGAVLMKDKELVTKIVNTVYSDHNIVLSLKIRVGVDDLDTYEFFSNFVKFLVQNSPVKKFYVHARKCWLGGLSPKQNRNIPSLNYEYVYRIKQELLHIKFILNGGIKNLPYENMVDGIMIGREAIKNILVFKNIEDIIYGNNNMNVYEIIKRYLETFDGGEKITFRMLSPLQNVLHGKNGSKMWKRFLNEAVHKDKMSIDEFIKEIETTKIL